MGLPLSKPDCKLGDFGCGDGYVTLSLMLHLNAKECFGVDKNNDWKLPTIEEAKLEFNTGQNVPVGDLSEEVRQLLNEERWPTFQQDDVLKPHDLPKNLDLAYCKRLLTNIREGAYNNSLNEDDRLSRAINNIVDCIKQRGLFCLVEMDFFTNELSPSYFPKLKFLRVCQVAERDSNSFIYFHFYDKR